MRKKIIGFVIASFFLQSENCFAQNAATPNPSFENWTPAGNHDDPTDWSTLNPQTSIIGILSATKATGADVHTGTYAIKLTTKLVFTVIANGIATTGTLITTPPYGVNGGIAFTQRPDSIVGWYKCAPQNGDHGFIEFSLFDAANDTVGYVRYNTPNTAVTTYTRFSAPINYFNNNPVALSQWILSSSGPTNQVVNSNIIIDDLDLIFNPNSISQPSKNIAEVKYDKNSGILNISSALNEKCTVEIFNTGGALCFSQDFTNSLHQTIELLKLGAYIVRVQDSKKTTLASKKIIR